MVKTSIGRYNRTMSMIEGLKTAGKVLQEAGKIEQYQMILDAQQRMLEMQATIAELAAENKQLREELQTKQSLIFESNAYWSISDKNKDGPFCSRCWDVAHNTVRLKPSANSTYSSCPECRTQFQTGPTRPASTPRRIPPSYC